MSICGIQVVADYALWRRGGWKCMGICSTWIASLSV